MPTGYHNPASASPACTDSSVTMNGDKPPIQPGAEVVRHSGGGVARARGEQFRQYRRLRAGDERHGDDRDEQQQEQHEAVHLRAVRFLQPAFALQRGSDLCRMESGHLAVAADVQRDFPALAQRGFSSYDTPFLVRNSCLRSQSLAALRNGL